MPALHSVGMPLEEGQEDVAWPCNDTKYIVQFPEERTIWSFGSGYGGNALLGKKCYALRIASAKARDEGWMAEHMLILKLTSPEGVTKYVAAAFPSACGKTNLAMLEPTIPGWKVEAIGDDIAWMRVGHDGRLWAVNPEYGFFGVAPGTNEHTNPNAMKTINKGNSVFTNVALTEDGDVWWEGLENPPAHATSWKGEPWTPDSEELSSHPNSRYCTPIKQCDMLAKEYDDPRGVPIDAILFGGRRKTTIPLVTEARDWVHGTFMGATLSSRDDRRRDRRRSAWCAATRWRCCRSSATTPVTTSATGSTWARRTTPRRCRASSTSTGSAATTRAASCGPGFGENSRVLKWVIERIEGQAAAVETPIGHVPAPGSLDIDGLDMTEEDLKRPRRRRRRGVEGGDPADHRVVREVRRQAPGRAVDRARRPQGPPRRLSSTDHSLTLDHPIQDPRPQGAGPVVSGHAALHEHAAGAATTCTAGGAGRGRSSARSSRRACWPRTTPG